MLDGYRDYKNGMTPDYTNRIQTLVSEGQSPHAAMIACADSRVDPSAVFSAEPGDIFAIRNVANFVPPMEEEGTYHGTSAALEFAVLGLKVPNIIVMGHAHCGGINAMIRGDAVREDGYSFIPAWVSMLSDAHKRVSKAMPDAEGPEIQRACEKTGILISLENLMTFPWVRERVEAGSLKLHGWFFDIGTGELEIYDAESDQFNKVV